MVLTKVRRKKQNKTKKPTNNTKRIEQNVIGRGSGGRPSLKKAVDSTARRAKRKCRKGYSENKASRALCPKPLMPALESEAG